MYNKYEEVDGVELGFRIPVLCDRVCHLHWCVYFHHLSATVPHDKTILQTKQIHPMLVNKGIVKMKIS